MKTILSRVWTEPAVAIGLMTSLALFVLQLIGDDHFTANAVIAILAPFVSSLGIRQVVAPAITPTTTAAPPKDDR